MATIECAVRVLRLLGLQDMASAAADVAHAHEQHRRASEEAAQARLRCTATARSMRRGDGQALADPAHQLLLHSLHRVELRLLDERVEHALSAALQVSACRDRLAGIRLRDQGLERQLAREAVLRRAEQVRAELQESSELWTRRAFFPAT